MQLNVPTLHGQAPLLLRFEPGFRSTVLVYHGLGSHKEVQDKEYGFLTAAGFLAVGVDAWGHGQRRLWDFDARMHGDGSHGNFLEMVARSAEEVPAIVDSLQALLGPRLGSVGISGISMGGYICFAAARLEPRLRALVPILGSPDWTVGSRGDEEILPYSPHLQPQAFAPRAVLACNGALDTSVPAEATRQFMRQLEPSYRRWPGRVQYVEYPHSPHFMREEDWHDVWDRTVAWFDRFLRG